MYCIYKATNILNNKSYIGFTQNFKVRKRTHKHNAKMFKGKFYNAIKKYGWDNFEWSIIFESWDKDYTLNIVEDLLIKEFNTIKAGYNTKPGGIGGNQLFGELNPMFGKTHTKVAREKMSKRVKEWVQQNKDTDEYKLKQENHSNWMKENNRILNLLTPESKLKSKLARQLQVSQPGYISPNKNVPKSQNHRKKLCNTLNKKHENLAEKRTWIHKTYGKFVGTKYDLILKYNIPRKNHINELTKVERGIYNHHKGWSIFFS